MNGKTLRCLLLAVFFCTLSSQSSAAADQDKLLKTIKSVQRGGKGNTAAQKAWKELSQADAAALPKILRAFDGASPLAANWLRAAFETIAARTVKSAGTLPLKKLESFILDRKRNPRARRMAFELLRQSDAKRAERMIPGMLLDPSSEMRRDAVARLITQAGKANAKKQTKKATALYQKALTGAVHEDQVKTIVVPLKKLGVKVDLQRHFGFLTRWQITGPFDNHENKGFNVAYPPEKAVDLTATYQAKFAGKVAVVKWTAVTTDDSYGIVDIAKSLKNYKGSAMYAYTEFPSDKKQTVQIRLGTPNSWKIWVNGKLLFAREEYHRGMIIDQYRVTAVLKPGRNRILLKILQNEQTQDWAQRFRYQIRICDGAGSAILPAVGVKTGLLIR
ncbi:MAG: hypothetical protein IID45_03355 [Planctomycetes bacterium]|nr:hypothetical protein [Planctomycetota bacterium]